LKKHFGNETEVDFEYKSYDEAEATVPLD